MRVFLLLVALCVAGCSVLQDAATSLAADVEDGAGRLSAREGATRYVWHDAGARAGPAARTIRVQFDRVGALIVWYLDGEGNVLESGSTTHHSRYVETPETLLVDLPIDAPVRIELRRRGGRAVVTEVR